MDLRRQPGPKHRGRNDIVGLRLDDVSFLGQQDLRRDRLVFLIAGNPSLMMEGEIDNVERRDDQPIMASLGAPSLILIDDAEMPGSSIGRSQAYRTAHHDVPDSETIEDPRHHSSDGDARAEPLMAVQAGGYDRREFRHDGADMIVIFGRAFAVDHPLGIALEEEPVSALFNEEFRVVVETGHGRVDLQTFEAAKQLAPTHGGSADDFLTLRLSHPAYLFRPMLEPAMRWISVE